MTQHTHAFSMHKSRQFFYDCLFLLFPLLLALQVFNFSTGRKINTSNFDSEVTAMDHDHTGQLIFCGDAQVCI